MIEFTETAVSIFGFPIRYYGILIALGVLAGVLLAERREKRYQLAPDTVIDLALWVLPASIIGARLYYVAFRLDMFLENPVSILDIRSGGMAIYGAILGGVFAGFLYTRIKHRPFFTLADLAAPSLAIGQAIGRWGNFVNQEAYGIEITNPALRFFPAAVFIESEQSWFAATFFYESAWCFLIAFSLLFLERKHAFRFRGAAAMYYASMYAFERFLVEGLRTDSLYFGPVRVSQALSALVLLFCAILLTVRAHRAKNRRAPAAIACLFSLIAVLSALMPPEGAVFALGSIAALPALIGILYQMFAPQQ